MNKKLLALLLAILMVAVSACAMAIGQNGEITITPSNAFFSVTKVYKDGTNENAQTVTVVPAEEIQFEQVGNVSMSQTDVASPDAPTLTFNSKGGNDDTWNAISISNFKNSGVFTWTIQEKNLGAAGVTYDTTQYQLSVAVGPTVKDGQTIYEPLYVKIQKVGDTTKAKIDMTNLVNVFETGTLTIEKVITGNLAEQTDVFPVKVTLTSTKPVKNEISISNALTSAGAADGNAKIVVDEWQTSGSSYTVEKIVYVSGTTTGTNVISFNNIPKDVTVQVVENGAVTADNKTTITSNGKTYTVTYENCSGTITSKGTIAAKITNDVTAVVETGVTTDSTPYILLMALVAIMALAFVAKKRSVRE